MNPVSQIQISGILDLPSLLLLLCLGKVNSLRELGHLCQLLLHGEQV